jgi:hypothetical protein
MILSGMQKLVWTFFESGLPLTRPNFSMTMKKLAQDNQQSYANLVVFDCCIPAQSLSTVIVAYSIVDTFQGLKCLELVNKLIDL